ncbi:MAG: mechanosensitive ion channel domain-containing protein [Noviherbaspirillum sp.]
MTHYFTGRRPALSCSTPGLLRLLLITLLFPLLAMLAASPALAQAPAPAPAAPEAAAPAAPLAIALSDVAVEAEAASTLARGFENRSRNLDVLDMAADELPVLARDMAVRTLEMRRLLSHNTPLETIRRLEAEWRYLQNRSSAITSDLTQAATHLERDLAELDRLDATWSATRDAAVAGAAPPAVLSRVREVAADVARVRKAVLERRARVLALQGQSAEVGARAGQATEALKEAGERAAKRLFYSDSLPLWQTNPLAAEARELPGAAEGIGEFAALAEYVREHGRNFGMHAAALALLAGLLYLIRSKVRVLSQTDGNLRRTGKIFEMPVVSALLLSLLLTAWFYPRPPRMFWIAGGVFSAIPTLLFSRRVIERHLYPVLYVVIGFYVLDKLRGVLSPLPVIWRWVLLAETVLFIVALALTLLRSRQGQAAPEWTDTAAWRAVRLGAWPGLAVFAVVLVANLAGYVRLADMLAATAFFSAFSAVVTYALTRVGEGLLHALLCVPPLSYLGMVRRHTPLLTSRFNRFLKWVGFLTWLGLTLSALGALQPLLQQLQRLWVALLPLGSLETSVGNVVVFLLTVWGTLLLSRLVRFVLEEEIFPKLHLERGLPYAINRVVHYVVLLGGFVIALGAMGVDMTKFTILAGAFSVGIGFGLQNIVNNFISGLIVLFERPIKVGDTIEIDGQTGRVQRIGIRASVIQSTSGAEVIIPNGKLISDKVINWTLSNGRRQISVTVLLKLDADVARARELVLGVARRNKYVLQAPGPEVLFVRRGIDQLEFELRVWTDALDAWMEVKSDMTAEINEALRHNEIVGAAPEAPPAPVMPAVAPNLAAMHTKSAAAPGPVVASPHYPAAAEEKPRA